MGNFGQVLAKMGKMGIFQYSALKIFLTLTNPNKLQSFRKSIERFLRNCVTNGRKNERVDEHDSLGLQRLRRETKNQATALLHLN